MARRDDKDCIGHEEARKIGVGDSGMHNHATIKVPAADSRREAREELCVLVRDDPEVGSWGVSTVDPDGIGFGHVNGAFEGARPVCPGPILGVGLWSG